MAAMDATYDERLKVIVASLQPNDRSAQAHFYNRISGILRGAWAAGALLRGTARPPELALFGSSASGLDAEGADLDMTLLLSVGQSEPSTHP
eukprot:2027135-Prymnesium_polylepis.1